MKLLHTAAPVLAALALVAGPAVSAQTTASTKVSTSTSTSDGVATTKTKVVHVRKHKSRRPRKILGVKVGHKTVTHKTVTETTKSTDGSHSMTVKKQ